MPSTQRNKFTGLFWQPIRIISSRDEKVFGPIRRQLCQERMCEGGIVKVPSADVHMQVSATLSCSDYRASSTFTQSLCNLRIVEPAELNRLPRQFKSAENAGLDSLVEEANFAAEFLAGATDIRSRALVSLGGSLSRYDNWGSLLLSSRSSPQSLRTAHSLLDWKYGRLAKID